MASDWVFCLCLGAASISAPPIDNCNANNIAMTKNQDHDDGEEMARIMGIYLMKTPGYGTVLMHNYNINFDQITDAILREH